MNNMEAALRYAALGWPIIPVHSPAFGDPGNPCSCSRVRCPRIGRHLCHKNNCKYKDQHLCHQSGCESVGKHPRTKNGLHDASTDEAKIRLWWGTWGEANIGVVTGIRSGFFVLDVDPREGGSKSLALLKSKHGKLPDTRTADTGGGGVHYLFKYPDFPVKNSTGRLGPGLDIKGEGGAIVVAPALHHSGKRYCWRNDAPIAEAPEWLLRLLQEEQKLRAYGRSAIGKTIPEGRRNDSLMSLAGTMRRRGMGADEIEAALFVTNIKRCNPPLAEEEVRKIAASVCRYKPAGKEVFR
jgi:Bifunctional DNA primase/polymerase, N-terminal/Primase C terminal 1 (PriCT-1)